MLGRTLANLGWWTSLTPSWAAFRHALRRPREVQERLLQRYLRTNVTTAFGRQHGFAEITSVEEYRERLPARSYDEVSPWIERIASGEAQVLTSSPVRAFAPSSGSTSAVKRISFTRESMREFRRAIAPWIFDMFRRTPSIAFGSAYWSITPVGERKAEPSSRVPCGFEQDTAYLGGSQAWLAGKTLAVPGDVRYLRDMDAFRYVSLRFLLADAYLRLISIWHPSFALLLVEPMVACWEALVRDIAEGTLSAPVGIEPALEAKLKSQLRPDPGRARQLARLEPTDLTRIWPRLEVISCWADGPARSHLHGVRGAFPGVKIEAKGLLATEGVVTVPFGGRRPIAVRSHFFEFIRDDGKALLADELEAGAVYSVLITTGGGLYRYRTGDLVRVAGRLGRTPCCEFVGRGDLVADSFGEKLSAGFVGGVLDATFERLGIAPTFAMLCEDTVDDRACYTLFIEGAGEATGRIAEAIQAGLCANPHYAYCVSLGQLGPVRVFRVTGGAYEAYVERCRAEGLRIGDVKPTPLSVLRGWDRVFEGRYV
ncbi:MAG: GH3 auxin-responsive promoter family protein [Planctomycetota bacterium]